MREKPTQRSSRTVPVAAGLAAILALCIGPAFAANVRGGEKPERANEILLNTGSLDTASAGMRALRRSVGSFSGKRLHLVQFAGPIQPEWYASLVATGVAVVQPIPSNAYLVWGDASAIGRAQSLAQSSAVVQWDGAYEPEYKIQPSAFPRGKRSPLDKNAREPDTDLYQVQLVKDAEANAATFQLVASILTSAVKQRYEILSYVNFVVGLNPDSVKELAARPDVVSIAKWVEPKKRDERTSLIMAGQLTGSVPTAADYLAYLAAQGLHAGPVHGVGLRRGPHGQRRRQRDARVARTTSRLRLSGDPALASRLVYSRLEGTPNGGSTLQGCDGHGNLNAHIIGGFVPGGAPFNAAPHADASGFRYGLGVAPFVKVGSSVIFDPNTFTFPNFENLQSKAYNDGARSAPTAGARRTNAYTADSQAYDALVRDAQPTGSTFPAAGNQEMVIVFAAGNDGSGANTVGAPGTAQERHHGGRLRERPGVRRRRRLRHRRHRRRQRERHHRLLEPRPDVRRRQQAGHRRARHARHRRRLPGCERQPGLGHRRRERLLHRDRRLRRNGRV